MMSIDDKIAAVVFTVVMAFMVLWGIRIAGEFEDQYYKRVPIASFTVRTETAGSFFLASGSFESRPVYYFYTGSPQSGMVLERVYATAQVNGCPAPQIVMDEIESPYVEKRYERISNRYTREFVREWPALCLNPIFHIPPGSIVPAFDLRAET